MIDLTVKTLDSQNHAFSLEDDQITVRGFKEHIAESVSVPADSQRLIYCGRVLQDDKKLNEYDVNGKVIHLVQRAPPQPGQRRNENGQGQGQGQNHGVQVWHNPQRTHYRVTRTQMHGNAMYVGAMSVPAEIVEGHALPVPQLSNRLSNTRLHLASRMLERANLLMGRLATLIARDPNSREPTNLPSTSEMNQPPPPAQQVQVQQIETDLVNESRTLSSTRLREVTAAIIAATMSMSEPSNVTLFRENGENYVEAEPVNDANEDNQPQSDTQQPQPSQSEQQGSESSSDSATSEGQSRRPSRLQAPRSQLMAALLQQLMNAQDSLRPYIERYLTLMFEDRVLPRGGGPGSVEESQTIVNGVSKSLHYLSHACHALSDIIVDMGQEPPRNLRCRPIMIQQSTILQPGVPIQVEAHFSIHGQNSNNNNTNEESGLSANTTAQSESNETSFESNSQQPGPDASTQQQTEQQEQTQSPFGTVFNLPNDMVVMAVNPEGNMDTGSGNEQTQSGENNNNNNNNNNNGARISGATGAFSWSSAPTDFIRNIMEAVAGHMVQGGIATTSITTQNHPTGAQQTVSSLDGNTNAGQSTQARSNVGTHPTTATQTRSTSRQQAHPLNVGMSIGVEFDPFLPCNSHHVRPTPSTTSNTVTSMPQRPRTSQPSTTESQPQAQTATTSATTTSNTSSTNITSNTSTSSSPSSSTSSSAQNPLVNFLQQTIGEVMSAQPQAATLSSNGNNPDGTVQDAVFDLARHIFYVSRCPNLSSVIEGSLNNFGQRQGGTVRGTGTGDIPLYTIVFGPRSPRNEGNFFLDLTSLVLRNLTLDDFISLRRGTWRPISHQRMSVSEFLLHAFPYSSSEEIQEQAANELLSQIRPHLQSVFAGEETISRNGARIDIVATIESLLKRHIKHIVQLLLNIDVNNTTFGYETFNILQTLKKQLRAVLRYSIRGEQTRFEAIMTRFLSGRLQRSERILGPWWRDVFISTSTGDTQNQLTEAETIPLLVYKTPSSQPSTVPSEASHQSSQAQSEVEPMETEVVEERVSLETPAPDDNEEIPETFPNHELLPSDWVPIIARDGVRQRRQLQPQSMTNGGVTTFSDAYLGTLPNKRRKLIEKQKPRLLVSPTPNHSAISASMERLVREGVTRAGVEEVDGAAIGVAVDPGVRRAFGQAIRDCLNPHRYESPDFPDSTRFPNATKYFADQDRPPK